jgi:hypothetical protein
MMDETVIIISEIDSELGYKIVDSGVTEAQS